MTDKQPPAVVSFQPGEEVRATFETSAGNFVCRLFPDACPVTVGNFVGLATGETPWTAPDGSAGAGPLYDNTIFHRVIPEFMIQAGDPLGNGTGGPGYRFGDEIVADLRHDKPGILSMANAGPGTNGSQFFVTEVATPWLDGKHTVFGETIEGIEVVRAIAHAPTGPGDRPDPAIRLERIRIDRG